MTVIWIACYHGTTMEIGRENPRLGQDPVDHGDSLWLSIGHQGGVAHISWSPDVRKVSVEVNLIGIFSCIRTRNNL